MSELTSEPLSIAGLTDDAADTAALLAQVRQQVVELLAWLDRPPSNLRVEAAGVTVDIAWTAEQAAPAVSVASAAVLAPVAPVAPAPEATPDTGEYLRASAVGVFYHAREPGAEPFVSVGSQVVAGQQIGVIEAMKLMIPVEADRAGTVTAVVKGNGESVEFDEPLFAIDPGEG
ncbi:MAG TPA: biotin/lipoyl-containing protein [Pseudonocardiaceae bacterium]|nr:biotin/lipoyl-containing protein [Pseudonocardiaceae bacterium]